MLLYAVWFFTIAGRRSLFAGDLHYPRGGGIVVEGSSSLVVLGETDGTVGLVLWCCVVASNVRAISGGIY